MVTDIAGYHYLVVDDDAFVGELIASMLHTIGATRVDIAENGTIALSYIGAAAAMPEIIICDLSMPQMDGVAFLRHLAERQFAGGIILASSSTKRILRMATDLAEAHRLNVLGALPKPFTLPALQNLLTGFAGVKKAKSLHLPPLQVTPGALRTAIEQNQLVPFFQPKVAVKTGRVVGVEALARWQHPEHGLIPPGLFIPVAEEHGLIDLLTQDILLKMLQQAAAWQKNGLTLSCAINFSVLSLSDVSLPDRLEGELRKIGIDSSHLTLEVTESRLLENMTSTLEILLRLHLKGIRLSIDDFGTGHSSLEQLHRIPFSELKIDRVFVGGAAHDDEARMMFQSAVTLAQKLNLVTVAEGVETQDDWDICARLNCDVVQGYFVARPMPGEALPGWYHHRQKPDCNVA